MTGFEEETPLLNGSDLSLNTEGQKKEGNGSVITSIFNMANCAVGAGILAFPAAFKDTGLIPGLIVTAITVFFCALSMNVIAKAAEKTKSKSYHEIVLKVLGKKFGVFCEIMITLYVLGALIAYMKVVGDTGTIVLGHFLGDHWYTTKYIIITGFSICVIFPLCLLKSVEVLGPASILAILSCSYLAGFLTFDGVRDLQRHEHAQIHMFEKINIQFFSAIPLITFAFICHVLVPPVYNSLKHRSPARFNLVIMGAMVICLFLYMPVAIFGYLKFGIDTDADILASFEASDIGASIGRLCIMVTVTLAYPINNFAARLSISSLLFRGQEISTLKLYLITIATFTFTLGIALAVPNIAVVISFISSIFGCVLVFILPALFEWKLKSPSKPSAFPPFILISFVIVGSFLGIVGTESTIYNLVVS